MHARNRPQAILYDPGVREFYALLEIARQRVADDLSATDKEKTARAMVEAYYRGQLDRERLASQVAA